ncbi:MAG: sulfatase-like hydrolase/transferase [Verrucomicrobia bacterium]|nr:sulfatase-like hydrolase/transferase [Verrucomicrobiota bacterium]
MTQILRLLPALIAAAPLLLSAAASRPPNILHLHADDHRADGLRALGNPLLETPNLDTLVARGTTFTHCYTMGSTIGGVCLPSRTMLLTGKSWLRIPDGRDKNADASNALPRVLSRAGYETFHVGKGGNEFTAGLAAFDTNLLHNDSSVELRRGSSERHADATIKFLRDRAAPGAAAKPFYIYFAPPVPHDPRVTAPEFHGRYDPKKIPLSPAFLPQHPFDNGEMTVRDEQLAPWPRTPDDTRQQLADYYACVTGLDHHIGRVLAELRARGEWDNTIIIFTGDNGLSLGEHGLFGKQNLYEFGGMHVPCVIAGPGIPHARRDALVYLMDLFPTFCDFAGAKIPDDVEGRSLLPIVQGRATKVRDVLYTAYRDVQRAIRDDRWKLIRYPQVDRTQLFDLSTDPLELNNLSADPAHAARVTAMTALLRTEMERYADAAPLTVANPKPAAWTPPKPGELTPTKKAGKAAKKT